MATLNINGRKVTVDDSFLSLPADEQNRTVDEIASQLGAAPAPAQAPTNEKRPSGRHLSYEEGVAELEKERLSGRNGEIGAGLTAAIGDLPIVGPALLGGAQRAAAGISSLFNGNDYETNLNDAQGITKVAQEQNPIARLAGGVAGNVAAFSGLGSTALGARALGITGPNLLARAGASGLSGAAISGADTAVRGGSLNEAAGSAAIGGGIGAAIPLAGAGLSAAGRAIGDQIYPVMNSIRNPLQEAQRRVGMAISRDRQANPSMTFGQTDEAVAAANNIPIANVDRGGETTRALARSVANQSPTARATIENLANDRFGTQSRRAVDFVNRLMGGNVDDLGYQEAIRQSARAANRPAYNAAYKAPEAQQVFTHRIQQLMQSPTFRRAVDRVPSRSADRGAVQGQKAIDNPFTQNSRGQWVLRQKADGTLVAPTLEFWDHVQRNLRPLADKAARAGDNQTASEVRALRDALNSELDRAVPAFRDARHGAAGFFGAEDAVDAGRNFANTPKAIPEARQALGRMSRPEREAFATGYASELIDKIKASGDRTNVVKSIFESQASRESVEMVLGPQRAREVEAYVRVESLVDRLRGSMGNSTTARQLVELGIGGAGGFAVSGGDWKGALGGALLTKGARSMGQRVDSKVMENVANLLTSNNPQSLQIAVQQASRNPAYMKAIEAVSDALAAPVRGGAAMSVQ